MSEPDELQRRAHNLRCAECGKISKKSFLQLEMEDRLPCDHCSVSIKVTDHYGQAELAAILISLGRTRFILRQREKGD